MGSRPKVLQRLRQWSADDLTLLAESAEKLLPYAAEIGRAWAEDFLVEVGSRSSAPLVELADWNRWVLERHLLKLCDRQAHRVLEESFREMVALLESRQGVEEPAEETLARLHLSLEIGAARVTERLQKGFARDPRLPALLALWNRLSLELVSIVGAAFCEVRSQAAESGLRAVSSLLEASRELNRSSASVDGVLAELTRIVRRLVPCDRSLAFLWRAIEGAYVAEAGLGLTNRELAEIRWLRLRRDDFPLMTNVIEGNVVTGTREDGPRQMMDRFGQATYAVAPILSSRGKPLGALVAYRAERTPFGRTELEVFKGVAQNASLAIESAMLVEHLEASVRFKSDLINSAPDAMIIADISGRIVLVNDKTLELFGYAREELLGQSIDVLVPTGLVDPSCGGFTGVSAAPTSAECDLRGRRKDGGEFPIDVSLSPIHTGEGELVTTAIRDITERKRFEVELARARDAALEAVRLKASFLANMSHEIRTPLNVISGYNQLIADYLVELGDESQQDALEGIQRASRRLIATVQSILDMSKIETATFEVRPSLVQLPPLVEQTVRDFQPLARGKGLALSCDIHERDAVAFFDPYCLSQALINLVDNAIKFTERGEVRVTLERGADGALRLAVRDTGIGIEASYRCHLFERFSQEDSGHTRRFEGSGLGLALVKSYVELNGARLAVESEKHKGSMFTICFADAARPSTGAHSGESLRRPDRPCVLVVEDDPETQIFMKALLGRSYEVLLGASGADLWRQFDTNGGRVGLVLMDLSLKGSEDGLELARALRAHPVWKAMPIVAVTAHAAPEDRVNALNAGCDAYVEKPVDNERLLGLVRRFLTRASISTVANTPR